MPHRKLAVAIDSNTSNWSFQNGRHRTVNGIKTGAPCVPMIVGLDAEQQQYQRTIFAEFNQYLRQHQDLYLSEPRFAENGFWQWRRFA